MKSIMAFANDETKTKGGNPLLQNKTTGKGTRSTETDVDVGVVTVGEASQSL
jgi:hypothetical protein